MGEAQSLKIHSVPNSSLRSKDVTVITHPNLEQWEQFVMGVFSDLCKSKTSRYVIRRKAGM